MNRDLGMDYQSLKTFSGLFWCTWTHHHSRLAWGCCIAVFWGEEGPVLTPGPWRTHLSEERSALEPPHSGSLKTDTMERVQRTSNMTEMNKTMADADTRSGFESDELIFFVNGKKVNKTYIQFKFAKFQMMFCTSLKHCNDTPMTFTCVGAIL